MITPFDDYPIHQTGYPLAKTVSGDANHYDRFFFNGYARDASLYFGAAMGLYPNRSVIDASFSVVRPSGGGGHHQVNVHASGRCPIDRTQTAVGPIRVEIVEPMKVLRIVVDAPEHGIVADLTYRARTGPVEEDRFVRSNGVRTVMDYTRLTQWGTWEGTVTVDGDEVTVSPGDVVGSRDRSWGIRNVGASIPGPVDALPQFFWLWAPVNFDDVCTHFDVNEDSLGRRWHDSGFVVPVGDGHAMRAQGVDYSITWKPGTRYATSFDTTFQMWDADPVVVHLEPMYHFQMRGIGYFHPERSHGTWMGELSVAGDRIELPVDDPLAMGNIHIQALCRATMGDREGIGILEQLVIGPHGPSGMSGVSDGASG